MIGWAFMHEVNIVPPLSHARFFLTQQVIYNSKIEKNNVSLDIFVSDTSKARIGAKLHFSYKGLILFFLIRFLHLSCSKSKNI